MRRRLLLLFLFACACGPASDPGADGGGVDAGPCELDTSGDPNNCGACGYVCPHRTGTTASCGAGTCSYACISGFADCNADLDAPSSDGCEVDLETDADHCGECANQCLPGGAPHSAGACESARCIVGCEVGWADCNSDISDPGTDGCEAELAVDAANCGSCHNACAASCDVGVCEGTTLACGYFEGTHEHPVAVRVAAGDGGFLIAWNDLRLDQLFIERLSAEGRSSGTPTVLVDGFQSWWRFDVGWDGARYVVVWEDGDAHVGMVSYVAADGSIMGTPSTLPGGGASSIAVEGSAGGVAAALDNLVLFITDASVESGIGAGEIGPRVARTADGFAAIGGRIMPPTTERPFEVAVLEHASLDSALMPTGGPIVLGSGLLASGFSTALVSFGSGALAVVRAGSDFAGPFTLQRVSFDARGMPTSGVDAIAGAPDAAVFDLAADEAGAWLTYGGANDFEPTMIRAQRTDLTGSFGAPIVVSDVRAGFLSSVTAGANAAGVFVAWIWRSFSGGADQHAIEGMFVRRDGTVLRPCD